MVKIYKTVENKKINKDVNIAYKVTSDSKGEKGLKINIGDKYRILESDGESALIEKEGGSKNSYFV